MKWSTVSPTFSLILIFFEHLHNLIVDMLISCDSTLNELMLPMVSKETDNNCNRFAKQVRYLKSINITLAYWISQATERVTSLPKQAKFSSHSIIKKFSLTPKKLQYHRNVVCGALLLWLEILAADRIKGYSSSFFIFWITTCW